MTRRSWISSSAHVIAGLAGVPELSLPLGEADGLLIGVSLIGPPETDEAVLDIALEVDSSMPDPTSW